jgi:hypothetical protein
MTNDQYQQLANQFIEMWQQQMHQVLTDKDFVQTMLSGLQQFTNFATPNVHDQRATNATRPAHTADASADLVQLLGKLDYRLRMVEARITQLEAKPEHGSRTKTATKRSRKASTSTVRKPAKGH